MGNPFLLLKLLKSLVVYYIIWVYITINDFTRKIYWIKKTVLKPTQVDKFNKLKRANEIWRRNSANWLCNFGRKRTQKRLIFKEVSLKKEGRLFTKNTGLCKLERGSIGTDTCPVLKGEKWTFMRKFKTPVNGGCNSDGPKVAKFLVG